MKNFWQLSIVLFLLMPGCSMIEKRKAIKNCDFDIHGVHFEDVRVLSVTVLLDLDVYNPNAIEVVIDKLDYQLFVEGHCVIEGSNLDKKVVPPQGKQRMDVRADVNYVGSYKTIRHLIDLVNKKEEKVHYQLKGRVYLATPFGDIPFDLESKVVELP